jgi:hypothetical protein
LMARIRTIKPEFPQSESVGRLSRDARLLFVQLWTVVDDYGRARAAPRLLAGQLYPYDEDAPALMSGWLEELQDHGFIRLYQVDGSQYLDIPAWGRHQRIDNAGKSNIPEFCGESPRAAASDGEPPLDLGPRKGPRNRKEELSGADAPRRSPDDFEKFWKSYPRTPVMSKKQALAEWEKLSPGDREAAARAVQPYRDWIAKQRDHPVVHACRFLSQRRFEGFDKPESAPEAETNWEAALASYRKFGTWQVRFLGPEPGSAGCRAPPEVLQKHGFLALTNVSDGEAA